MIPARAEAAKNIKTAAADNIKTSHKERVCSTAVLWLSLLRLEESRKHEV